MNVETHEKFEGVYWVNLEGEETRLATKNLAPGHQVYDEKLIEFDGEEYRIWNPYRSKLAAAIFEEIERVPINIGSKVLYLGAASGTTPSHVSDIVGGDGIVYGVEISSRPVRDLLATCKERPNIAPILADAQNIQEYRTMVEQVDVLYQDIAHPEQTSIVLKNAEAFLREKGYVLLALKARSIDVTKDPQEIFEEEIERLEKEMKIIDSKLLDPYEEDHAMILLEKTG